MKNNLYAHLEESKFEQAPIVHISKYRLSNGKLDLSGFKPDDLKANK